MVARPNLVAGVLAIASAVAMTSGATDARAQPADATVPAPGDHAAAAPPDAPVPRPRAPHVLHTPTAWMLPRDHAWGSAGLDHRGAAQVDVAASLGGLAEVDLGLDDAIVACACEDGDPTRRPQRLGVAGFKLGLARGPIAGALGVRHSFAGAGGVAVAALYAVTSVELGPVRGHAGVMAWDARTGAERLAPTRSFELTVPVRPFAGLEWTPAPYPRTTLIGDLSWLPELDDRGPRLRWIAGWGVRYQALSWGSIELDVRHREGDDLGGSTVMVRVNGAFDLSSARP